MGSRCVASSLTQFVFCVVLLESFQFGEIVADSQATNIKRKFQYYKYIILRSIEIYNSTKLAMCRRTVKFFILNLFYSVTVESMD